jgi:hypothetical protein
MVFDLMSYRPFLKEVNASNPQITSLPVSKIYPICELSPLRTQFGKVSDIDFGLNNFSFYIDESSLISLDYKAIKGFQPEELHHSVQVCEGRFEGVLIKWIVEARKCCS